jgi:hypothetical protein
MFGPVETVIVKRMDIGKTIRCYTIEPLRDPVPAPREYSVRVPDREPVAHDAESSGEQLDSVLAPNVLRRISG